jgi:DNA-binding CsgD family transcriptional regulator
MLNELENRLISEVNNRQDISDFLYAIECNYWFWQQLSQNNVGTISCMPRGFFESYYGHDLDDHDPIAWAVRANITGCTFKYAREIFLDNTDRIDDVSVYLKEYDAYNGVVITNNMEGLKTVMVLICSEENADILIQYKYRLLHLLICTADVILGKGRCDFYTDRRRWHFTEGEMALIRLALGGRYNTVGEQAVVLGIMPNTVNARRAKIMHKLGVTNWITAVSKLMAYRQYGSP